MDQTIVDSGRLYRDPAQPLAARVADLIGRMTLPEKIGQLVFTAPAIPHLDVAAHNWWNEGLHGVGRAGVATVFPQAIGLAATWNPALMGRVATAISDEARAKHHTATRQGIFAMYTGLSYWSPNINLFRDPRWGRGQETYGEDPYLTASMGVAFVRGLQGDDPHYLKLAATPKHFAVHSGPELLRHHFDARVDECDMRDFYLFAFEAAVKEGRAASIMGAYNRTNGEPCCASPTLLEQILRREWGFDGYVVSDCEAITDIYAHHKVVATAAEAAALAVRNGCELECGCVYNELTTAFAQGLIDEATIDRALMRLFSARFRLGMFDPPENQPYAQIGAEVIASGEHQALALQAARESIVLLKNEGGLLPLSKQIGTIAVIGPTADDMQILLANYNGTPSTAVTPLEGIRRKLGAQSVLYSAPGCALADGMPLFEVIPAACLRPINGSANARGLTARYYDSADWQGAPVAERIDAQVDFIWKDSTPLSGRWNDHFSVRWEGTLVAPASGDYTLGAYGFSHYRLSLDGELLLRSRQPHHPVLQSQRLTLEGGRHYQIQLDYANEGLDPQIQLLWARHDRDLLTPALEAAAKADVVVMLLGLSPQLEGEEMPIQIDGFAGGDRTKIDLPATQQRLLEEVHALGKPVVLVLTNGSALALPWAAEHIPALVEAWYPGQAGGLALADVLFGDYNPAGRLPVTFYQSLDDLPPFADYALDGRTYRYFRGQPLYPFGHGLSYTQFDYSNLRLDQSNVPAGATVAPSFTLHNSGARAGEEVVQLYVRQHDGKRALIKLVGFARVALAAGERRTLTFHLHTHQLGQHDAQMRYIIAPQTVELLIGRSSADLPLRSHLTIRGPAVDATANKVFFSKLA